MENTHPIINQQQSLFLFLQIFYHIHGCCRFLQWELKKLLYIKQISKRVSKKCIFIHIPFDLSSSTMADDLSSFTKVSVFLCYHVVFFGERFYFLFCFFMGCVCHMNLSDLVSWNNPNEIFSFFFFLFKVNGLLAFWFGCVDSVGLIYSMLLSCWINKVEFFF